MNLSPRGALAVVSVAVATPLLTSCQNTDLGDTVASLLGSSAAAELTSADISTGLKQALEKGVVAGVDELSREGGYFESAYRIGLPEETEVVFRRLRAIPGFTDLEGEVLRRVNAGAEDAVARAAPIFVDAITQLTFADALAILRGEANAATEFLRRTTYDALFAEFQPVIRDSLDRFGAQELWSQAITRYNRLPLITPIEAELDRHVTNQALDGLFTKIAEQEADIRQNTAARTTDLLRRVFA
ncbi:MAG: DUF4197 domain-containing protein, partial [Opitutales bacterium]